MLLYAALFTLWLTTNSAFMHKTPRQLHRTSRKILSSSLDKSTTLAAHAATRQKFRNAPALLLGQGTSPGYLIPPSLQDTYDHAADYVTNITLPISHSYSYVNSSSVVIPLSDETDDIDDFEYYGPLLFGSQDQPLQIDFDTGSADLWVPGPGCDCPTITSFLADASTTYHNTNQPFEVTYGSGAVFGTLVQDSITVGSLQVLNQSFGAVDDVSPSFSESPSDGLAGLAFSTISTSRQLTLFENLISQQHLAAPLFSFYMTRTQPRGSEVCFGGIDQSKVKGNSDISWVPVTSKTYWTVNMTGVLVTPNTTMEVVTISDARTSFIPAGGSTIIDTGTSFIYISDEIVAAIYKQIPESKLASDYGDGFYSFPCNTQAIIWFVFGAITLALDPRDMNLGRHTSDVTGQTCIGAIVAAGSMFGGEPIAILGDSFLKSYVSIFDYSHDGRVGFVKSISGGLKVASKTTITM